MSEQFKPVFVREEVGPYDKLLGHVEIHDDAGVFAGYDPTPAQVLDICKKLGMTHAQYRLVLYATKGFYEELIDEAYWGSRSEETDVRKLVGVGMRNMFARNFRGLREMENTRRFTPQAKAELMYPMDEAAQGVTAQGYAQTNGGAGGDEMTDKIAPPESQLYQAEDHKDKPSLNADIAHTTGTAEGQQLIYVLEDSGVKLTNELKEYIKSRFVTIAERAFQLGTFENQQGGNDE